ncbi:hypothetical protein D2L64_13150 [Micromonospora radicis]|uniref:Uncharacterized protein n=1 Tax=Micromonospora radicis TaxID=1894971 RepID=A0A418MVA2_9ACTN|nr:hypothetical protein D2L64_13150 [Micromonospora radicis]
MPPSTRVCWSPGRRRRSSRVPRSTTPGRPATRAPTPGRSAGRRHRWRSTSATAPANSSTSNAHSATN